MPPRPFPFRPATIRPLTGKVLSGEDNTPLIGVTIVIKTKKKAVQSDVNGNFSIDAQPGDVLSVSYIGYAPQEIAVTQQRTLKIILASAASRMDEVVITGYGSTKGQNSPPASPNSITKSSRPGYAPTQHKPLPVRSPALGSPPAPADPAHYQILCSVAVPTSTGRAVRWWLLTDRFVVR